MRNDYQYALIICRKNGEQAGQASVRVDWNPALECFRFSELRSGREPAAGEACSIQPIWHRNTGPPYVEGFRIRRTCETGVDQGNGASRAFTTAYFADLSAKAATAMVEKGILEGGETYRSVVVAYESQRDAESDSRGMSQVRRLEEAAPLKEALLADFLERSAQAGLRHEVDFQVFAPGAVLDELVDICRRAGDRGQEAGGMLIGHLHRDSGLPDVFAGITAQIPARHTVGERDRLTFTPETWTDMRAAVELRNRDELLLGWYHSHPIRAWCEACPPRKRSECSYASDYFSEQDRVLHRTVFPLPYHTAIVVNDPDPEAITLSAFGWREGRIEARGIRVLDGGGSAGNWRPEFPRSEQGGNDAERRPPAEDPERPCGVAQLPG